MLLPTSSARDHVRVHCTRTAAIRAATPSLVPFGAKWVVSSRTYFTHEAAPTWAPRAERRSQPFTCLRNADLRAHAQIGAGRYRMDEMAWRFQLAPSRDALFVELLEWGAKVAIAAQGTRSQGQCHAPCAAVARARLRLSLSLGPTRAVRPQAPRTSPGRAGYACLQICSTGCLRAARGRAPGNTHGRSNNY